MKLGILTAILALGLTTAALADPQSELRVTRQDCSAITAYVPSADVEYRPGVDVRGRPVAPADLPGSPTIRLPDEIAIDIGFNLAEKYGIGAGGRFRGETVLGRITVQQGRAYWNDQLLADPEQHAIAEACRKRYESRK